MPNRSTEMTIMMRMKTLTNMNHLVNMIIIMMIHLIVMMIKKLLIKF